MTVEERIRKFTTLLEDIHHTMAPLTQETMMMEEKIGYENYRLIDASDRVVRLQNQLQSSYVDLVANCENDAEVEILLKEFEEEFYNVVLDYRNFLKELVMGTAL
ncbi:MAG TPA: hypothetical protein VEC36_03740 [Patescibacteria group bacterium]|nr:hypothetical protein [Patescibacteria group bacterium]